MRLNPFQFFVADWRRRLPYRRFQDLEDRPRRLAAQNLSLLTLLLGALYHACLGRLMLRAPGDQSSLFFIAEPLAYLRLVFLACALWRLARQTQDPRDWRWICAGCTQYKRHR